MSLLINHFYQFGEFTLDTDQRTLLRNGKPLPLTPKVFDTLLILVENNGRVVTKEELMTMLWPKTFVEDSNLTFNIKQLRKSLGDDARHPVYIETLARRGYRFIADVEAVLTDLGAGNGHLIRQVEFATAAHPPDDAGLPVGEKNFTATPAPGAASRGRSKRSAGLAAALVIVLAVVGFVFWLSFRGPDKNSDESPNLDGKSPATAPLKFEKLTGTGQSRQVAISPDGKYVAYTRLLENKAGIWLRQLSTNTNVEIVPAAGFIIGLAFTNSGESIYFVRGDPVALYRVSLVGGALMRIVDKLEGNFSI